MPDSTEAADAIHNFISLIAEMIVGYRKQLSDDFTVETAEAMCLELHAALVTQFVNAATGVSLARLKLDVRGENWMILAACRGADPNIFFPTVPRKGYERIHIYDEARAFCLRCPVVTSCLLFGIRTEDPHRRSGFWGNATPSQRIELAKRMIRTVVCEECGREFDTRAANAKLCGSKDCERAADRKYKRASRLKVSA